MSGFEPFDLDDEALPSPIAEERELRRLEDETDLKWLLDHPRGRRFMRRHLERTGVFRTSFSGDALSTAFREGERNIGLMLLHSIATAAPAMVGSFFVGDDDG